MTPQAARRLSSGPTVVEVEAAAPTLRGGLLVQVKGSNSGAMSSQVRWASCNCLKNTISRCMCVYVCWLISGRV
jgi:hypothetical protein